jgi:hypothetical protein
MTTTTENKATSALRTAENASMNLEYVTSLLSGFNDQWGDLKQIAKLDREEKNPWRLVSEFERVSGRVEVLLNLTDQLLQEVDEKNKSVIDALMDLQKEKTA